MRLLISLLLLASSVVFAQFLTDQTPPFNLVISSTNKTINGSILYSCHEGAAIQALCLTSSPSDQSSVYRLNYTAQRFVDPVLGNTGVLTWTLEGVNFNASTSMKLGYDPTSNVAVPLLTPMNEGTTIGFDNTAQMYIPGYADDTSLLNIASIKTYRRWFVCDTNAGYKYKTLAWVVGLYSNPQNPTCQKVEVVRRFI
ncbi:hypothetical protein K3495_g9641 [Podosphaera aphanis]|nr:hypothetical protein K3495_g9641 [Podosphaera aphanis]